MAEPLIAGLPPGLALGAGYQVRVNALDPTTGAAVAGVLVSNVSIFVLNLAQTAPGAIQSGPFLLVAGPGD